MRKTVELAIVILNYRTAELTIGCLNSLINDPELPIDTHIMIVDGASDDGSAEAIASEIATRGLRQRVSLLPIETNGGFAYGNNRGIGAIRARFGEAEYYLLLNPDTIVRPSAVAQLLDFMKSNPAVGICGSRLEDPDGTPQACAFRFLSVASEFESSIRTGFVSRILRRWSVVPQDLSQGPSRVDWVSGASMLVRSAVFREVGLMDEQYFLYYEEVDFTLRASREGWACWHVPQSRVVHLVGQATGVSKREGKRPRRPRYWFESRRRYFMKNHGRAYAFMANLAWVFGTSVGGFAARYPERITTIRPFLLRDFVKYSFSLGKL